MRLNFTHIKIKVNDKHNKWFECFNDFLFLNAGGINVDTNFYLKK